MHGQKNDKYTEMHCQQNYKYTEMHGQQNPETKPLISHNVILPIHLYVLAIIYCRLDDIPTISTYRLRQIQSKTRVRIYG